jgi:hypothetical protein
MSVSVGGQSVSTFLTISLTMRRYFKRVADATCIPLSLPSLLPPLLPTQRDTRHERADSRLTPCPALSFSLTQHASSSLPYH